MNPQQNDDAAQLKARLSALPPARPAAQVNVPSRPSEPLEDIDDSAFAFGAEKPQLVHAPPEAVKPIAPAPIVPRQLIQQPAPVAVRPDIAPPAPRPVAPAPVLTPVVQPVPQPVTPPTPPVQPVAPLPPPQPAPAPTPPPQPTYTIAPPMPPQLATAPAPPPQPIQQTLPPRPQPVATPVVTTPIITPKPAAAAGSPTSAVSYQPPTQHIAADVVERIDETPQQNSSDIEHLIQHTHRLKRLKGLASFLVFLAGVVFAAFLLNQFVFQSYYVDGTSMTPTLQNDDRLIIDKVGHTWSNLRGQTFIPERGQIVVLDSSIVGLNGREEQLIKRAIGLPGDTIIIKDGVVTIKNKDNPDGFDVDKKLGLKLQPTYSESPIELTIGENEVFVMGDNRAENGSYDSRAFGPIKAEKIVGRLWARILPLDKAQVF